MSDPLEDLKQMLFKFGYKHPDEAKPFKELAAQISHHTAEIAKRDRAIEVFTGELKGISLGSSLEGKITEQEALDLINNVLSGMRQVAQAILNGE